MGLQINYPIIAYDRVYSEFYARIEGVALKKDYGSLQISVRYYENKKGSENAVVGYVDGIVDLSGAIIPSYIPIGGAESDRTSLTSYFQFTVSETRPHTVIRRNKSKEIKTINYVDYDENGIAVVKTKDVEVVVINDVEEEIITEVYDIDIASKDILKYSYGKIKETFELKFGSTNIKDV